MSLNRSKSAFSTPQAYLVMDKAEPSHQQYIRVNNNSVSILDSTGKIIQQTFTDAKTFPINLSNEQICHRSMLNNTDNLIKGYNYTAFYIGASNSGKQRLFDGDRTQNSLVYNFIEYILPQMQKKYHKVEVRMKMVVSIKQKIYDCLSQNRYSIVKLQQDVWDGVRLTNATNIIVQGAQDCLNQLKRGSKQKNKLVLQYKQLYTSYLALQFIHENEHNDKHFVVSRLNIIEVPGVQILSDSHSTSKLKESSSSVKSLLNFTSVLGQYAKNQQFIPYHQNSVLTLITKEIIASNSIINVFFTFRVDNIEGSLATLKFIKPFNSLKQYPIINQSFSLGLLRKYRAENFHSRKRNQNGAEDKDYLENEVIRLQTEEDYQRIMEKYVLLKQKYNQALKAKSQSQLQLIKCQEEKLQIGKSLVEVQIENTKLLQKLQNKDYETGKKQLTIENKLAQKQMSYQEMLEKIQQMNQSLNEALQTKRDLEVEFIALKRNFIMNKKQLEKLKEDNQNLSLDLINITNLNEKLKNQILNGQGSGKSDMVNRSMLIQQMERQKYDELKRENKAQEQNITYLKSEIQRFKKQLIQNQSHINKGSNIRGSSASGGKNYDRIQLQSQNMQLVNRLKLRQRKIDELEQKVAFFEDQNQALQNENRRLKIKDHNDTQEYRKKLEGLSKNSNTDTLVKELKDNFVRKDTQNLDKINALARDLQEKKRQNAILKGYIRQLIVLLQQWSPKGAEIPEIKKYTNLSLGEQGDAQTLKIRNRRLQQQIRRLKQAGMASSNMKQSRVMQQYNYLKESSHNNGALQKLRNEKNNLLQQNRRLTMLLKDGNKMDLNIIKRENDSLKQQIQHLKSATSISPSTSNNDQKLGFYQKHIKKLQKQRSQLLSRCVVAEQQLKNVLSKIGAKR